MALYNIGLTGSDLFTLAQDDPANSYAGGHYTTSAAANADSTAVVDNSQRSYLVQVYFNGGGDRIKLHTVQIEYLMPTIRPLFFMPIIPPS